MRGNYALVDTLICSKDHFTNFYVLFQSQSRPSKCPKPYPHMISGEKQLAQKSASMVSRLILGQIAVISKVYSKILFILLKYPVNTPNKSLKLFLPFISWSFYTKSTNDAPKRRILYKTLYVKSNKFTPIKKILHLCCR